MTGRIQFQGWITFEDALRVERLLVPRKFWSFSGVTTIAIIAAIGVNVVAIETSWPFILLFLAISGVFIGGLFWLTYRSGLKAKRKRYARDQIERSGTLSPDLITVVTDKTKTELKWGLFDKVVAADNLVLVAKDKEYLAFAPYMFSTEQEWDACKTLVNGKTEKPQPADGAFVSPAAGDPSAHP